MKNKKGFTLAEILITLGIVGIVAALTAPALVKNSGQAKIGPALSKFVNTFETACEQIMIDENVSKLSDIAGTVDGLNDIDPERDNYKAINGDKLVELLSNYIIMVPAYKKGKAPYYTLNVNGVPDNDHLNNYFDLYQLKDGSIFGIQTYVPQAQNIEPPFKGIMGELWIDINGDKGNNNLGKEVFLFLIDDSGILIPVGSKMYYNIFKSAAKRSCDLKKASVDRSWATVCAGAIADNGWKADY